MNSLLRNTRIVTRVSLFRRFSSSKASDNTCKIVGNFLNNVLFNTRDGIRGQIIEKEEFMIFEKGNLTAISEMRNNLKEYSLFELRDLIYSIASSVKGSKGHVFPIMIKYIDDEIKMSENKNDAEKIFDQVFKQEVPKEEITKPKKEPVKQKEYKFDWKEFSKK